MHVSVVIPTYNRAKLLVQAIDSVLAQSYKDYEVLIVDDGSTDNTIEVLGRYGDKIRIIRQPNKGEGPARNAGISAARGEYIAFLDSDDIWTTGKLEAQMNILEGSRALEWGYSDAFVFFGDPNIASYKIGMTMKQPDGNISRALIMENFIPSPTPIVKAKLFTEFGKFSDLKIGADWEMWLRIASKYPVGFINEPLAGYRVHDDAIMQRADIANILEKRCRVIQVACDFAPEVYASNKRRATSWQYILAGREMMNKFDRKRARKFFIQAIFFTPTQIIGYSSYLSTFLPIRIYQAGRKVRSNKMREPRL